MAGTVLDVALIKRLLAKHRPIDEIVARTGASLEQVNVVRRNFDVPTLKRPTKWGPHEAELRRMHAAGMTSGQVAAHYGVTRNSIISVWQRLGLHSDQYTRRRRPVVRTPEQEEARRLERLSKRAERERIKRAERRGADTDTAPRRTQGTILAEIHAKPDEIAAIEDAPQKPVVPILVLDERGKIVANERLKSSTCRWYIGDPTHPGSGFCPEKAVSGLPYCEAHAKRAFQPPTVRRPRQPAAPKPERVPTFADAEVE